MEAIQHPHLKNEIVTLDLHTVVSSVLDFTYCEFFSRLKVMLSPNMNEIDFTHSNFSKDIVLESSAPNIILDKCVFWEGWRRYEPEKLRLMINRVLKGEFIERCLISV